MEKGELFGTEVKILSEIDVFKYSPLKFMGLSLIVVIEVTTAAIVTGNHRGSARYGVCELQFRILHLK